MSILTVPSTIDYPPGFIGNPYTPNDVSVFFDLNWPDHAGIMSRGFPYTYAGMAGFGDEPVCVGYDESGNCDSWDTSITSGLPTGSLQPTPPVITTPAPTSVDLSNIFATQGTSNVSPATPQTVTLTPAQQAAFTSQLSAAQQAQLIAAIGNSAVSLVRTAAGGPYTVAGTNLVYNPATGQLTTSTAVNSTANLTAGLASIGPYVPWIIGAIAAVAILPSLFGGKR